MLEQLETNGAHCDRAFLIVVIRARASETDLTGHAGPDPTHQVIMIL
jgi:hypothetical protein